MHLKTVGNSNHTDIDFNVYFYVQESLEKIERSLSDLFPIIE